MSLISKTPYEIASINPICKLDTCTYLKTAADPPIHLKFLPITQLCRGITAPGGNCE